MEFYEPFTLPKLDFGCVIIVFVRFLVVTPRISMFPPKKRTTHLGMINLFDLLLLIDAKTKLNG